MQWQRNMTGIGGGLRRCSHLVTVAQQPWAWVQEGVQGLNLDLSLNPTQYSVVNSPPRHLKD